MAQGQTVAVTVSGAAKRQVVLTVSYGGLPSQTSIRKSGQADSRGHAGFSFMVVPGPANGKPFLTGSIVARTVGANIAGITSARFKVFPAPRLVTSATVVAGHGSKTIVVSVQLDVRAQILATLTVPHAPSLSAHGTADGRHRVELSLSLAAAKVPASAHITIMVKTKDGVTEMRSITVVLQR